jgi:hypothetical protein
LLNPSLHCLLRRDSRLRYLYHDSSDDGDFSRRIDGAFGPWPARLLNHHWWQWKLESFMGFCCSDDGDDEGCS